jgi:hypothetical protein
MADFVSGALQEWSDFEQAFEGSFEFHAGKFDTLPGRWPGELAGKVDEDADAMLDAEVGAHPAGRDDREDAQHPGTNCAGDGTEEKSGRGPNRGRHQKTPFLALSRTGCELQRLDRNRVGP